MSHDPVIPPYNASDPSARFLSSSCLDFLLIELVPLAYRVTREQHDDKLSNAGNAGTITNDGGGGGGVSHNIADMPPKMTSLSGLASNEPTTCGSVVGNSEGHRKLDEEDEELDTVHYRLESLGYRVGQGIVERFSCDRPRLNDTLDVIKFLCKDLWCLAFGKNIDNLKTNHRGVYVLTDNMFRPFARMSTETGGQAVVRAQPFLWFPSGIVRGALAAMGINAMVQTDINELPGAVFQIKTLPVKT